MYRKSFFITTHRAKIDTHIWNVVRIFHVLFFSKFRTARRQQQHQPQRVNKYINTTLIFGTKYVVVFSLRALTLASQYSCGAHPMPYLPAAIQFLYLYLPWQMRSAQCNKFGARQCRGARRCTDIDIFNESCNHSFFMLHTQNIG